MCLLYTLKHTAVRYCCSHLKISHGKHAGVVDDSNLRVASNGVLITPSFMKIGQYLLKIDVYV
jgi:hypothetical protein